MSKSITLEMKPEDAENLKSDLMEIVKWFEGFEAGRGSRVPVNIESIRNFSNWISAVRHIGPAEHDQF